MTQKLIIGLGNPGKKYEMTRHNMGYLVVKAFAAKQRCPFKEEKRFNAYTTKGQSSGKTIHLLLPTTYMNDSGRAMRRYLDYYKLGNEAVIVIADDIALPFGMVRIRSKGSAGGHNGLKSIESHLGTNEYIRLRVGIGRGDAQEDLKDHVLDTFTSKEAQELPRILEQAVTVVESLIAENVEDVMNRVNVRIGAEKKNER